MVIGDAMSAPWTFLSRMRTRGRPELTAPSSRQPPTRCWPRCVIRRMQELFVLRWCWRTGASFGKPSGHHVGLVQEDGRAGTEGRRTAAGGPESSGKTRASHGRDSRSFHGGRAEFEDSCGGPTRKFLGGGAAGRIKVREACPKG